MTGNKVTPTSTTIQARVMLYQPSQRPKLRKGNWEETSFGRCRVTGRLGQRHADALEAALFVAEEMRDIEDGGIELLIDPAKIRKTLSDDQYSLGQIKTLFAEMRMATLELQDKEMMENKESIIGGLVDHLIPSEVTRHNPLNNKKRQLWRLRLGVAMVILLKHDLKLYYDPAPIARLKHGITQAVVRHILSHKHQPVGGWFLDTLIEAVAGPISGQDLRNARRRLKGEGESLREFGIEIEDDRVKRATPAR